MKLEQEITNLLLQKFNLDEDKIEIIDEKHDGRHYFLRIISEKFKEESRLQRSRAVHDLLKPLMKDDHIHALRMELKTSQEITTTP